MPHFLLYKADNMETIRRGEISDFPPKFEIRTPQFVKSIQVLDY
jgi:hypothetical protein